MVGYLDNRAEKIIKINKVFEEALMCGRNTLYEHEVYKLLNQLEIETPKYIFIKSSEELNDKILEKLCKDIVVKIVSSDIAHKSKLGGVKKINNYDSLYVRYVLDKMEEEVMSHYENTTDKPKIEGFLIVEYIDYNRSLGYEILIGAKLDESFGPVVTLSKGGDDAEFFAKYYDEANLFLPPLNDDDAKELVNTLRIKHKFEQIGHPEYLDYIAMATSKISYLIHSYSLMCINQPKYILKELDVNPFVITKDNRFVAIDGYVKFEKVEQNKDLIKINTESLDKFFKPKGVAVIGVSSDKNKYSLGREIVTLLHDFDRDDLYCINNKGGNVDIGQKNYTLYKSIEEIEAEIELVVFAAPLKHCISFFANLKTKTPKSVILIPGVPSEIKYQDFKDKLKEVVPSETRIIGPNCMGVYYAPDNAKEGINTLFIDEKRLELKHSKYSNTVLLTQSGGLAITIIDKLKHYKLFKSIISFGNKLDVKIPDLLKYFCSQEDIEVISLYVEGFSEGEGRNFFEIAKEVNKPVIIYKGGKTSEGAKAAASHTASMAGDYDVFKSACSQAKVILADSIKEYYDYIKAFALLFHKVIRGNRVAGVVNAGFESTAAADELGNMVAAKFSDSTVDKLSKLNVHGLVDINSTILDLTAMTDDKLYADFIEVVLQEDKVDCLFISIVPHIDVLKTTPDTCRDEDGIARLLIEINKKYDKPFVVCVNGGEYYRDFVSIIEDAGIPVYNDIKSAVKSLGKVVEFNTK